MEGRGAGLADHRTQHALSTPMPTRAMPRRQAALPAGVTILPRAGETSCSVRSKSGLLPPNLFFDNRSGFPSTASRITGTSRRGDATFTPFVMTRRGFGLDSEFATWNPATGAASTSTLPHDCVTGSKRWSTQVAQRRRPGRRLAVQRQHQARPDRVPEVT